MKKIAYNLLRKYAMQIVTGHLGRVEEAEDKLICYVNPNKCKRNKYNFIIPCKGIGQNTKDLAKTYDLDKPICYVIEGIKVNNKKVYIFGYDNAEILIKDCVFAFDVYGHINGKCTIEDTFIRCFSTLTFGANELTLKDMSITNQLYYSNSLKVYLGGEDKLEVIDSTIGKTKESTEIYLIAGKELNLQNAKIAGDKVECQGAKITSDKKSSLTSTQEVKIQTEDFDPIRISSPVIKYNEQEIQTGKETVDFEKITDPLKLERVRLINTLKKVKDTCEQYNRDLLEEYTAQLEEEMIYRTLKRGNKNE